MKATSIEAYNKKEEFAGTHRERIVKALNTPSTGKEISSLTGLNQHQVMKRMNELVTSLEVFEAGTRDNQTIYYKASDEGKEVLKRKLFMKRYKKYLNSLEALKKTYSEYMPDNLRHIIDLELE